jgi:aspartate aminotransferase-like enzyme
MKFDRIVIWGLRKRWHTHRFIHKAFYENAKKLGYKVIWVEDEKTNANLIRVGDLIEKPLAANII